MLEVGATAVRRDTRHGKVWTAAPHRVLADDGDTLVLAMWPGVRMRSPTTWIEWLRSGDDSVRKQAIPNLAAGRWELGDWTWRDTTLVNSCTAGDYFSVQRLIGNGPTPWYVNFEIPFRRTAIGIDTFDLLLDLIVAPDLSGYTWKDEDEYAQGRRIGLIDDALDAHVRTAKEQVVALIEAGQGPFAQDWSSWRPDLEWPLPALPADVLDVPC
jgi:hypothetical protein